MSTTRIAAVAALLIGGFAATSVAISNRDPLAELFGGSEFGYAASAAAGACAAMLVALFVRRRRVVTAFAVLGIGSIGLISALPGIDDAVSYIRGIGSGLLLGALAALCGSAHRVRQAALATGTIAGLLLADPIRNYLRNGSGPRRYADYLPDAADPTDWFMLVLCGATLLALVIALWCSAFETNAREVPIVDPVRVIVVGIALPACCLALHVLFSHSVGSIETTGLHHWSLGLAIVPVVAIGALWLPKRHGMVLLAVLAVVAASANSGSAWSDGWPTLLMSGALVAAGTIVGHRWPHPVIGTAGLAVVAASGLLDRTPLDGVHSAAQLFALPFAAAFTVVACLPSSAPVTAIALATPGAFTVPLITEFGWTAYSPLTSSGWTAYSWSDAWQWYSTGAYVAAVVIAGVTLAWLQRRPPVTTSAA
ncbi:hypothetical protein [Antrihabitans cavernicola]|uniref:MFS transporter n=1 Tax=Antrihabitans cavernicola TaxID=2495913 RepID=A0A5A7S9V8_9NOCA|nr:hypothetical protein [Spelaeibacter cavernicola]KAA0022696.1 hypothetical protein FOY51_13520 [Spelaeibacter cavernicola]